MAHGRQMHYDVTGPVNIINGDVNNLENHTYLHESSAVPEPIDFEVRIPEVNFVGRSNELEYLEKRFQQPSSSSANKSHIVVVSGLGGIGKTQLVRKFIDKNRSSYENVVWINSAKSVLINESFKKLADRLGIPISHANGKEKSTTSVLEEVLNKFLNRKSLFIYDDVETIESIQFVLLISSKTKPHTIFTSRIQDWSEEIDVMLVKTWKVNEAKEYVSIELNNDHDSDDDKELLVKKLQYFPLALRQATAYIKHQRRTTKFQIADYVHKYHAQEMLDSKIFPKSPSNLYDQATCTTWSITIDAIQKDEGCGPLAVQILNIIAYFAPENIQRDLFRHLTYKSGNDLVEFIASKLPALNFFQKQKIDFKEHLISAINMLINYSMVHPLENQSLLRMHRLVQRVIKLKLKEAWQEKSTLRVALQMILNYLENAKSQANHSHAISVFLSALGYNDLVKEFKTIPSIILLNLIRNGNYMQAKVFGDEILLPLTKILGENHPDMIQTKATIAGLYIEQGLFTMALQMSLDVLEKQKNILGALHPATLITESNVALSLRQLGMHAEALNRFQEVFAKQIRSLGDNHPDTLITASSIALLYSTLGMHADSLQTSLEVFEKQNVVLGEFHPNTLVTEVNIAFSYRELGIYTETLKRYENVFLKQTNIFGIDHPSTLKTKANIAMSYSLLGMDDKALPMFQEVFEKQSFILGEDHPNYLVTKSQISQLYTNLGMYTEALQMFQEVFDKEKIILGEDHPVTLITKCNIAGSYRELGLYTKALKIYQDVFQRQQNVLGKNHPSTLKTKSNIATLYSLLGMDAKALLIFQEVFQKQIHRLGEDHPNSLAIKAEVAQSYTKLGMHTEALQSYREVFEKQKTVLGEDHPITLLTKSNLGYVYMQLGMHTQALQINHEVLEKEKNNSRENHPNTLITKSNIAFSYRELGMHTESLQMFEEVFEKQKNILGENHPSTLKTEFHIAISYKRHGLNNVAFVRFQKVFDKQKKVLRYDHPDILKTKSNVAELCKDQVM